MSRVRGYVRFRGEGMGRVRCYVRFRGGVRGRVRLQLWTLEKTSAQPLRSIHFSPKSYPSCNSRLSERGKLNEKRS